MYCLIASRGLRSGNSSLAMSLVLTFLVLAVGAPAARGADIMGAWATDVRACDKIFQKKGNVLTLSNRSDTYGGGFVIDGTNIREKLPTARSRTEGRMGLGLPDCFMCD